MQHRNMHHHGRHRHASSLAASLGAVFPEYVGTDWALQLKCRFRPGYAILVFIVCLI